MEQHAPDPFRDTFAAMTCARAVVAATRLGIFDALATEPSRARALGERLGLDPVGLEALFEALVATGYLEVDDEGRHRPSEVTARSLITSSPESVANFVGAYNAEAWEMLGRLEETLLGHTASSHERPAGDPFWEPYIRGLFELSRAEHDHNASLVPLRDARDLLDVAGGHGGFAMAMCRRHENLAATVLDLPASASVGRRIVDEEGFAERVAFREGDALRGALGTGRDVISMFNLLHHLSKPQARTLLGRAHDALAEGGWLVVGETERVGPGEEPSWNGALSGLAYYAQSGTRNYTRAEIEMWLGECDFSEVRVHRNERSPWRLLYLARG